MEEKRREGSKEIKKSNRKAVNSKPRQEERNRNKWKGKVMRKKQENKKRTNDAEHEVQNNQNK